MNPRTIQVLLALYPRRWRHRYEPEYAELLTATPTTPLALLDVIRHAAAERLHEHRRTSRAAAAIAVFAVLDALAVHAGITDNILWAPTTPQRAAALALTVGPLVTMVSVAITTPRDRAAER